jgi:hypothetical protein
MHFFATDDVDGIRITVEFKDRWEDRKLSVEMPDTSCYWRRLGRALSRNNFHLLTPHVCPL